MKIFFGAIFALILLISETYGMTYYDYFVPNGTISSGLVAEGKTFTLNGKDILILSGAFHYFRVHPAYWRDTLKKLRAAGLNAVETYMPWNLHNPQKDIFDFGNGQGDMSIFLNVRRFIQLAQEEDLFVILRPGPYICSEWEFGGMPSWILGDHTMNLRTSYKGFEDDVDSYLKAVSEQVSDLFFQKGGPIVAVQIENEYGHFGYGDEPHDKEYLQFVKDTLTKYSMGDTLLFTSDSPSSTLDWGALPGVLMTANFQSGVDENLDTLERLQPDRPMMVMEFWTGWFDHWLSVFHVVRNPNLINGYLEKILSRNASVNFYMFIGGTNFGFMAGANKLEIWPYYTPIVSSYDYDAPLTEAGDYGPKYSLFQQTMDKHNPLRGIVGNPAPPAERPKGHYGKFPIQESMSLATLVDQVATKGSLKNGPLAMEDFNFLNDGNGQSYGYAFYTTTVELPAGNSTLLVRGHVRDMAQVLINGKVVTKEYSNPLNIDDFGFWNGRDKTLEFHTEGGSVEISILVENLGRVNFGKPHFFHQKKGLWEGPIYVNDLEIKEWTVCPLEFKTNFINSLTGWESFSTSYKTPAAYRVEVNLQEEPQDTFLNMRKWNKGVVFLNGFNLGRYWKVGPTKSLYLPAPFLKNGTNEFVIFEQYDPASELVFIDHPILGIAV